jgi:predicted transcriptional regulator
VARVESLRYNIKRRVEKYLELDVDGIRKVIIKMLLSVKKITVESLYQALNKRFKISRSTVASMIGYIHSKLGILHAYKESYKTPTVYTLKEEYGDLIRSALNRQ